ncbi:hypothetical protein QCA50_014779 [Cerrena zonata]|uniref:Uncharacterized protein n=1 Tax=Cerrena zonata TaxID=2478898 RepID=A0AAW0FQ07_9APHY
MDWQTAIDPFVVLDSETDQPVHRPPLPSFATGNVRGNAAVYSEAASFALTRHSVASLVSTRRHDNVVMTAPGHDHAIMIAQRQPSMSFPRRHMNQHALVGGLSRSRGSNREVRSDEYSFVRTFAHPTAMSGVYYDDSNTSSNSRVYPDNYGPWANQPTNTTAYADDLTEYEVRLSSMDSVNFTHPSDSGNAQTISEHDDVI